jgi:hypothetical protein
MKTITTHLSLPKLFAVESALRQVDPALPLRASIANRVAVVPPNRSRDATGGTRFDPVPVSMHIEVPCPDELESEVVAALLRVAQSDEPQHVDIQVSEVGATIPLHTVEEELVAV